MSEFIKWNDKELKTNGDIMTAMKEIYEANDKTLADKFMAEVMRVSPLEGRNNIGYMTGYFSQEVSDKMRDLFDVTHPVFGRKHPTPDEALAMGEKIGRAMMDKGDDA